MGILGLGEISASVLKIRRRYNIFRAQPDDFHWNSPNFQKLLKFSRLLTIFTGKSSWRLRYLSLWAQTSPSASMWVFSGWVKFQHPYAKIEGAITFFVLSRMIFIEIHLIFKNFWNFQGYWSFLWENRTGGFDIWACEPKLHPALVCGHSRAGWNFSIRTQKSKALWHFSCSAGWLSLKIA